MATMAQGWRPWADDTEPPSAPDGAGPHTTSERSAQEGKGVRRKQGLRNVTNRQQTERSGALQKSSKALETMKIKAGAVSTYGPSPRVLRGEAGASVVDTTSASEVSAAEPHPWDDRVQQLQERFRDSPKKAIVEALKHTSGHAGKAARLLRSQWSPSALRSVTRSETAELPNKHEAVAAVDVDADHASAEGRDSDNEDEEEDDLASQAGRSIAAASASLQNAVVAWADTTDTALRTAVVPSITKQHRNVAVQYTDSGLMSEQEEVERRAQLEERWMKELHDQAQQMITTQQRLESELDHMRKQGIEEREELRREHREEIDAWQQKAAALQAEVAALQKARREQRRQQRRQQREMASLVQTAATRADEASAQLRVRRNRLQRGVRGSHCADVGSVASGHSTHHHGDDDANSGDDADRQRQQKALNTRSTDANTLTGSRASSGSDPHARMQWSSDDDELQSGYSSCVEPPGPDSLQESHLNNLCAPPGPSPPQQHVTQNASGGGGDHRALNLLTATSNVDPAAAVHRANSVSQGLAETPALDQRRRDRQRFLAATEGLPGITGGSVMRLPKDRHTGRIEIEPAATRDNSTLAAHGGLSKLRATSSRSERGRDRHAAAAAEVQARRLRQAKSNEEQPQPHRTRSGPAATLIELQQMAELYEAGDQPLLSLGTADNAADRRRVGLAFLRGEGVDRNTPVAAHFLREAADLGDAAAQCWLATCYAEGWGVRPDQNEAANLYAVSARSGYARAQNNLAVCYADGRGRSQDRVAAVRWWKHAAASGDATALTWLGVVHATGWGDVQLDEDAAEQYFTEAARKGDVDAQAWLSDLRTRRGIEVTSTK